MINTEESDDVKLQRFAKEGISFAKSISAAADKEKLRVSSVYLAISFLANKYAKENAELWVECQNIWKRLDEENN